jgi:hypothetical protein
LQHTRRGQRSATYTQTVVDVRMSTWACHKQALAERPQFGQIRTVPPVT